MRSEFDAPEVRSGGEEFDADARAFFAGVAQIDDAAFLILFGDRIGKDELGAHFERSLKIEQAAVGIDDDGFAVLAEIAALGIFAGRAHTDAREDTRTAPRGIGESPRHGQGPSCNARAGESTT